MSDAAIFDVLVNDRGEVLLSLNLREGEPDSSIISIDTSGVMLVRNPQDSVNLPGIPEDMLEKMKAAERILVLESTEEGPVREYFADVSK